METQLLLPEMPTPVTQEEERRAVERVMGLEEGTLEGEIVIEETPEATVAEAIAQERSEFAGTTLPMQYEAQAVQAAAPQGVSTDFEEMKQLAQIAEASGCFPGQTFVTLLTKALLGKALGVSPAIAFQNVIAINNQLSLSAELQRALLIRAGYRYHVIQSTIEICEMELFQGDEVIGKCSFTLKEAQGAGLVKPGGAWGKYPSDMLFARCSTRLVTRFVPHILFWAQGPVI